MISTFFVRSFALLLRENASAIDHLDEALVNEQRELLLQNGLATGARSASEDAKGRPHDWTYTHLNLTDSGERLVTLSKNDLLWQRANEAYEFDEEKWSLADLYTYLEDQSAKAPYA